MPERDPVDFRPPQSSSRAWAGWVVVVALALGAAWWFGWRPAHAPQAPPPAADAAAPASAPAAQTPASAPLAQASGPANPVDALAPADTALPSLADSDATVAQALRDLLGAQRVARFLLLDGLVRRAVVTVDNLAQPHAPARLWPVQPAPGRFLVTGLADAPTATIDPANAARYHAFVDFAESVPLDAAVKLYARLYPLFQSAYEELGYPGRYFNDRLVAVLDVLLATPEPAGPVAVQLTQVKGEVPSTRPWVRYEYADPQLESLSSGQKMLVRMGPDNARRLKAVMTELRRRVATGAVAKAKGD
ncbi:MAG: DUF3014 domain-containing protein [Burkholderiaceae bacterium]|nr:DUF3014 domain-containing protein [Pseudomonadota bacterium]MBS0595842.1 DUF3014 domain-containing protein [Pseudomonadota bacterium]MCO5117079.1 DUF3014 domain-containing protein [Burkholderiaceae bacterium]MCP5219803.1 DUF3014 domain-containing protein [Burkholderiaceae bacterium]